MDNFQFLIDWMFSVWRSFQYYRLYRRGQFLSTEEIHRESPTVRRITGILSQLSPTHFPHAGFRTHNIGIDRLVIQYIKINYLDHLAIEASNFHLCRL